MGWFLSNSKKKSRSKTKRGKSAGPSWDPNRTLLGVKFAGFAGGALAVALGWHYGTQKLEAAIADEHAAPITAEDIRFSDKPTLMGVAELNQLRAELAGVIGESPLNGVGLKQAAERLEDRHDIVRVLRQVRRTPEGTVEIDLDFRVPAAVVRMRNERTGELANDGYHVVDNLGYQMYGPKHMTEVAHLGLPLVLGVSSKYRPRDNEGEHQWQGQELNAALSLIAELRKTPALDLIESIAVNDTDGRGRIRLWINTLVVPTRGAEPEPCRILWGLPPGQEKGIEIDADKKLRLLIQVLTNGQYRLGHWETVSINTGTILPNQAISGRRE